MHDVKKYDSLQKLEDFSHFCSALDINAVIAAADAQGRVNGREKELYAIAILRAVENGDFGTDRAMIHKAISTLWDRGCREGFNRRSFNAVFEQYFSHW